MASSADIRVTLPECMDPQVARAIARALGQAADDASAKTNGKARAEGKAKTKGRAKGEEPASAHTAGRLDFLDGFRPGDAVEAPGAPELGEMLPTRGDALAALASALELLSACSDRVRVLEEQAGRAREVTFGQTSERLSALGLADDGDERPDTRDGQATEATPTGAEPSGDGGPTGEGARPKGSRKRPRRRKGCAEHVGRDAIRVTQTIRMDEAELERLLAEGRDLRRLSDGSFKTLHVHNACFLVETRYERWQDRETGETFCAASAAGSKTVPNSPLGADVLAELLFERYVLALTAPKAARLAVTAGLGITRQTVYRLSTQLALSIGSPLVGHLLWHVVSSGCAQSDESWLRVREDLRESGRRNSVLWLVRTSELLGIPPAIVVSFTGTRAASALAELLEGFAGKLLADGYSGYPAALREMAEAVRKATGEEAEEAVTLCGCLQHARSKFADALQALSGTPEWEAMPREQREALPASRVLLALSEVFRAEREMPREAPREVREAFRRERVRPLFEAAMALVDGYLATPLGSFDDYLGKALRYADGQRGVLSAAVDDPDVPLNNSSSEREFANLASIRNASRQVDSAMGAWTLATWFSVVRTARANGADERAYLQYAIERAPGLLREHGDWEWHKVPEGGWGSLGPQAPKALGDDYLEELMPWSEEYREYEAGFRERRREELEALIAAVERPPRGSP